MADPQKKNRVLTGKKSVTLAEGPSPFELPYLPAQENPSQKEVPLRADVMSERDEPSPTEPGKTRGQVADETQKMVMGKNK